MDIAAVVLDEGKWLFASLVLAAAAVTVESVVRRPGLRRAAVVRAMSLFYGCMIGCMGAGHMLAVAVKAAQETLAGPLVPLIGLGVLLALPAWWLVADRAASSGDRLSGRGAALNALAAAVLLATGLHNLPLAVPAAINIAYGRATGRGLGRVLLAAAVGVYGLLLAGSIAFMASGKTFEEFRGIR